MLHSVRKQCLCFNNNIIYGEDLVPENAFKPPPPPTPIPSQCGSIVVGSLFIVAPIVCDGLMFGPCFVVQYFVSF